MHFISLLKKITAVTLCIAVAVCSASAIAFGEGAEEPTQTQTEYDDGTNYEPLYGIFHKPTMDGIESFFYLFRTAYYVLVTLKNGLNNTSVYFLPYEDTEYREIIFEFDDNSGTHHIEHSTVLYDPETNDFFSIDGRGMLTSGYNFDLDYIAFYTVSKVFQRTFGYTEIYDSLSFLLGYDYDTVRVRFEYGGTRYMYQFWKGTYVNYTMVGGEIGIYYLPEGRNKLYICAEEEMYMPMSIKVYNNHRVFFERDTTNCWWMTGFTPAIWRPARYISMDSTLLFPNEGMRDAFVSALDEFPELSYELNGNEVLLYWPAVNAK